VKFSNDAGSCVARLRGDVGMIGSFVAADEPDAVARMLHDAARWLREQGATQVIGPMDGDTWHHYRVNAGPFEEPPFLLEPVNPPYYDALWRHAGFEVIETYTSKRIQDVAFLAEMIGPFYERAIKRGYNFRSIDLWRLDEELELVWRLSLEIFRDNAWYSDISLEDFLKLYAGIEQILERQLVLFAEYRGEAVGFLFAYPDDDPSTVNYKTIGVVPAHRRGYVAWAMLYRAYWYALNDDRPTANHCLMHEWNSSQSMDIAQGETFRNYYLYALPA
jgi:hypothetical protein